MVFFYDLRDVIVEIFFFCKGLNFKEIYLENVVKDGLEIYVFEVFYEVLV